MPLPNAQTAYVSRSAVVQQTQVVMSATYQFLDNTFAHPYVAGGARVGILDVRSDLGPYGYVRSNGSFTSITVPVEHRQWTDVRVRPFLAFGSKAYFSERTFVRPEVMVTVNGGGLSQVGLRLGFGIDF